MIKGVSRKLIDNLYYEEFNQPKDHILPSRVYKDVYKSLFRLPFFINYSIQLFLIFLFPLFLLLPPKLVIITLRKLPLIKSIVFFFDNIILLRISDRIPNKQ